MDAPAEQAYPQIIRQQQQRIAQLEAQLAQRDRRIAELGKTIREQAARIDQLTAQVARLLKNSSNSSKPPSSDIVKPPPPPAPNGVKRHIGGQEGHPRHQRPPFAPDQIDRVKKRALPNCPNCGGPVRPATAPPRVIQQAELVARPVMVTEYQSVPVQCRRCGQVHYAPLPPEVEAGGLLGPKLTALVAYLKGACHASFSTIRKFLRDVLRLTVSRGQLAKVIHKASAAMEGAYDQLRASLPTEDHLNVDETGHKEKGKGLWTWCFRADLYTLFKIDPSRGSDVLVAMLGEEFEGVLGCDYFSAYRKYMGDFDVIVQFCLAHLIRDTKFLTTLPDAVTANYGRRVLEGLRRLFHLIHRREAMEEGRFQRGLERARDELIQVGRRAPQRIEAMNLAERFRRHGRAYFQFITTPGIEPTNNLAEQAIRFVVIDRLVTQGTRSERGRRWCERIWTAIATCAQQGRSVFEYLGQSIAACFVGKPAPSLLPAGP
jgi:transposase